ncbi:MAG: hypothetical protein KAI74_06010 [Kiritimatiellae bacterium]|nr:hypothetical protein [Kiritimatiellia bacterium]
MRSLQFVITVLVLLFSLSVGNAGLVAGRSIPDGRDAGIILRIGQVASIEASIKDQNQSSGLLRQDYSLKDLGVEGGYVTYGLSADKAWKFFGLQLDLLYFGLSEDITAQQNYHISVDSIGLSGADYLHVVANSELQVDLTGGIAELHGLFTPISFQISESITISPWVSMGVMVMGGDYDLNNGEVTAVVSYGAFSESYSVGGSASGTVGLIVPDVGVGGEIRVGAVDDFNFVLNAHYSILPMSEYFAEVLSTQSGATDVTLDYTNIKINGSLEMPLDNGKAWVLGVQYELLEALSEMNLNDDLFEKSIDFNMTILTGSVGLRF